MKTLFYIEEEKFLIDMLSFSFKKRGIQVFKVDQIDDLNYLFLDMRPYLILIDALSLKETMKSEVFLDFLNNLEDLKMKVYFTYNDETKKHLRPFEIWAQNLNRELNLIKKPLSCLELTTILDPETDI